jgi:ABC-type transport system involved in multi-copper enzyme maturation permease subunit
LYQNCFNLYRKLLGGGFRVKKKLLKKRINLLDDEARHKYNSRSLFNNVFVVLYWTMMVIFLFTMIIFKQEVESLIGKLLFIALVIFVSFFLPVILLIFPYQKLDKNYPNQS